VDDDDVTLFDLLVEDRLEGLFLGVKDTGTAREAEPFLSGDLRHAPLRSEVSLQDDEVTLLLMGSERGRTICWPLG